MDIIYHAGNISIASISILQEKIFKLMFLSECVEIGVVYEARRRQGLPEMAKCSCIMRQINIFLL